MRRREGSKILFKNNKIKSPQAQQTGLHFVLSSSLLFSSLLLYLSTAEIKLLLLST
jgi:hypothetical protein